MREIKEFDQQLASRTAPMERWHAAIKAQTGHIIGSGLRE
jgi:hypothetical protein